MLRSARIAAILLLLTATALAGVPRKRVLILHEGSRLLPYQAIASEELQKGLMLQRAIPIEVFEEFLDTWRLNQDQTRLASAIENKYFERKFDVIVADGAAALTLLLQHPPKLAQETPVVFLTVADVHLPASLPSNITGVATHIDYSGIVGLAAALQPDLKHLYYIQGSQSGSASDHMLHDEFAPYREKVEITTWSGVSLPDLLARVGNLPFHSAILYDSYAQDPGGVAYVPAQVCSWIAAKTNVPVYVPYETLIGKGAAAGVMVDFRSIARQATKIVLGVLGGAKISDYPVERSQNVVMVDWKQVRRYRLDEASIPPSAIVVNREPTTWERYRWYIILAILVFLIELALILALAIEGWRRRSSEAKARELAGRLIDAQEDERRRIARELHDDLSQRLAWTCIQLDAMRQSPPSDELLKQRLTELFEETDSISSDVHNLSHELHPAVLERLGLAAALRQYCDEFSAHRKVTVHLIVAGAESPLGNEPTLALFRVAQECLCNVAKHSGVTDCTLKLLRTRHRIRLSVLDEGKGIESSSLNGSGGLGLQSMRERLRSVGGILRISSNAGHGTAIYAEIPLLQENLSESKAISEHPIPHGGLPRRSIVDGSDGQRRAS